MIFGITISISSFSLKNFQYGFAFYVGLVVILGDMFLFKRYWIDDLWSILMLPVVAYILGYCICVPAWIMADSNKQVEKILCKNPLVKLCFADLTQEN